MLVFFLPIWFAEALVPVPRPDFALVVVLFSQKCPTLLSNARAIPVGPVLSMQTVPGQTGRGC